MRLDEGWYNIYPWGYGGVQPPQRSTFGADRYGSCFVLTYFGLRFENLKPEVLPRTFLWQRTYTYTVMP